MLRWSAEHRHCPAVLSRHIKKQCCSWRTNTKKTYCIIFNSRVLLYFSSISILCNTKCNIILQTSAWPKTNRQTKKVHVCMQSYFTEDITDLQITPGSMWLNIDHVFLSSAGMVKNNLTYPQWLEIVKKHSILLYLFIHRGARLTAYVCTWLRWVWGSSPWHYSIYVSETVCVGDCSINQSSAVIVSLIVRYVPVGLEALVCVIHVRMCV